MRAKVLKLGVDRLVSKHVVITDHVKVIAKAVVVIDGRLKRLCSIAQVAVGVQVTLGI